MVLVEVHLKPLSLSFFFIFRSVSSSVTLSASARLTYIASPPHPPSSRDSARRPRFIKRHQDKDP